MTEAFVVPFAGNKMSQAFAALPAESLAEGIGSSYGIIGYKGKVWSLRYRGEKHTFVRDDDGSPSNFLDVIILRSPNVKSKSYYPREEGYDPNSSDGKKPTCSAIDGVTPDSDIAVPQANACAACVRNEWKTDPNGKKSRECSDAKRLAVLIMPAQTKKVLGSPLLEPVFLRVPPASLNDLATMGETMEKQGWHYSSFVTRVSFDPEQPHPKMIFRPILQLTDAEAPVVMGMREDTMALRITGEDVMAQRPLAIAAPARQPQVAGPGPATPPPAAPSPATALAAATASRAQPAAPAETGLLGALAGAAAPAPASAPVTPPAPVQPALASPSDMGLAAFAGLTAPVAAVTAAVKQSPILDLTATPATPAAQTAEDVGMPSEADSDLDARVAKLLEV